MSKKKTKNENNESKPKVFTEEKGLPPVNIKIPMPPVKPSKSDDKKEK